MLAGAKTLTSKQTAIAKKLGVPALERVNDETNTVGILEKAVLSVVPLIKSKVSPTLILLTQ